MTHPIKLLALDIDGTLMGLDFELKDSVKKAISKVQTETNIKIILASGRMTYSTLLVARDLNIDTPLITYQGAMVNDIKNNKILFHQSLNPEAGLSIIENLEKQGIHVNVYVKDTLYIKNENELAKAYTSYRSITPVIVDSFDFILDDPPTKILGIDEDTAKIQNLISEYQKQYQNQLNIFSSYPIFLEIVSPNIDKGATVIHFAKKLWNIDPEQIMAIGDGNNDYSMIKGVGYGIAMGNATDKIKSAAKFITKDVNDDGAAYAINKFIFNGG